MREKALKYYKGNYNCSQCILKAAEEKFRIKIDKQCYKMCKCYNNGLGIGAACSALEAGVLLFGILFDEKTCLRLRMKMMTLFQGKYHTVYCCKLKKILANQSDCKKIIGDVADIVEQLIHKELNKTPYY